ncbi:MAG: DoxX family protein [Campylobacter sp.]|nr:DoxX family protein [Campylobacter sp.]
MKNQDLGLLFIRFGLGICLFMHGFAKILHGVGGVKSILAQAGLPEFLAYFAYLGEVVAPLMIAFGIFSRIGSLLVIATSFTILYSFNGLGNLFALTTVGGFKAELLYLYIAISLCLLFTGSGKYAVVKD